MARLIVFITFLLSGCVYHDLSQPEIISPQFDCSTTSVTWQSDVLPIMISSCAITGCHDGISRLDWRDYNRVKEYALVIKRRTSDRSMPVDEALSQEQIDKIACWVDQGALNN